MADALDSLSQLTGLPAGRQVFGAPVEREGVTLVPVARVRGGGGGGGGEGQANEGSGIGFGISAEPVGAFELSGGRVRWVPALDVTRVVVLGQLVVAAALLLLRPLVGARRGRRGRFA